MHFLITGHTGFKGAWLTLLLKERGHSVSGFSLGVDEGALFEEARIQSDLTDDLRGDIRSFSSVINALEKTKPDVVIHLAAQSLVRRSYDLPEFTLETNVLGTANVLSAISQHPGIKATLIVTTDKVYFNRNNTIPYKETDTLKGSDPYSSSKALADLYAQSWIEFGESRPIGIARAGNVIGGGDVCAERLVPEIYDSLKLGREIQLRYPEAIRPWQHVLDCLNGYLTIVNHLITETTSGIWNIGPTEKSNKTVRELTELLIFQNSSHVKWVPQKKDEIREEHFLSLNSIKAMEELKWRNYINFEETVSWTSNWYKSVENAISIRETTLNQIRKFEALISPQSREKEQ